MSEIVQHPARMSADPQNTSSPRDASRGVFVCTLIAHAIIGWVYLSTLLAPAVLPLVDLGGHVELGMALRHLNDGTMLARTFKYGTFPAPNSIFYLLFYAASAVLAPLTAAKAIVGTYLLATPLAAMYLLHATRRNVMWSLAAYPMLLSWPFQSGFLDYCLSFAPMFIGFALLWRALRELVSWRLIGALVLVSATVFLAHFQGAVFYCVGCACILIAGSPVTIRSLSYKKWIGVAFMSAGVVVALMLVWFARSRSLVAGEHHPPNTWQPGDGKIRSALSYSYLVLSSDRDGYIPHIIASGMLLARVLLPKRTNNEPDAFLLIVLANVVIHALAPVTIGLYWNFDNRMSALFAFFTVFAFAADEVAAFSWRAFGALSGFVVAALAVIVIWMPAMDQFESWNAGFLETLTHAPKNTKLAFFIEDESGSGFEAPPTRHYAGYHALNLGSNSSSFADHPGRIVVQRQLGNDFEFADSNRVRSGRDLRNYQVLMQRGRTTLDQRQPELYELIARHGMWAIYRIKPR